MKYGPWDGRSLKKNIHSFINSIEKVTNAYCFTVDIVVLSISTSANKLLKLLKPKLCCHLASRNMNMFFKAYFSKQMEPHLGRPGGQGVKVPITNHNVPSSHQAGDHC